MENHALHGDGIYYEDGDNLWVNLYVPSTAEWADAGVKLAMETDFPVGETAKLTLDVRVPERVHARDAPAVLGRGRTSGRGQRARPWRLPRQRRPRRDAPRVVLLGPIR